jgi:hypothetical protein
LKSIRFPTETLIATKNLVKRLKRALNKSERASAKRNANRNSELTTQVVNARIDLYEECETNFKCLLNFIYTFS